MKYRIRFLQQNLSAQVAEGTTIFNAANWAGLPIEGTCGGRGACGKCKVKILEGTNTKTESDCRFLSSDEIAEGWRLSCRSTIHMDTVVDAPRIMAAMKTAPLGLGRKVILAPNTRKLFLQLPVPSLVDQRSDVKRVGDALNANGFIVRALPSVWRELPALLRANNFAVTAVLVGDELIAVEAGDTTACVYGLALDVGTTTVVGALINLDNGSVINVQSTLNGQACYGADVIARISFATQEDNGLALLHAAIIETISYLIEALVVGSGLSRENIYETVVVGNATMMHLLLEIDPRAIGVEPFIPAIQEPVTMAAEEVGIRLHPEARLTMIPHLGAYVGSDIVAGVLSTNLVRNEDEKPRLFIDVGTNGEIVLGSSKRAMATSAAAGPAFEGAQIMCGMRACEGAIERVRIDEDVHLRIIGGNVRPIGICGSGLIDAVAELLKCGLLDPSGRLAFPEAARGRIPDALVDRLATRNGSLSFLLSSSEEGIVVTQADIRALQFAKAAIATGTGMLMAKMGIRPSDLHETLLAGAFGSYIHPASARAIGLVPWLPLDRIVAVGNSAGEGAKIALLSYREMEAAHRIPDFVEYVELSGKPEFNEFFTKELAFPAKAKSVVGS
jgi:uncharacterized 2Fe-2S/4Fe-4S cluster protein (DUF4445 family)